MQSKTWKLLNYNFVSGVVGSTFFAYIGYRIGRYHSNKSTQALTESDCSFDGLMQDYDKAIRSCKDLAESYRSYNEACDRYLRKLDELEA